VVPLSAFLRRFGIVAFGLLMLLLPLAAVDNSGSASVARPASQQVVRADVELAGGKTNCLAYGGAVVGAYQGADVKAVARKAVAGALFVGASIKYGLPCAESVGKAWSEQICKDSHGSALKYKTLHARAIVSVASNYKYARC
jgi:hypothetical protein